MYTHVYGSVVNGMILKKRLSNVAAFSFTWIWQVIIRVKSAKIPLM